MVNSTQLLEVDINKIATDLNGKLDRDGINASSDALHNMGGAKIQVTSEPVLQQDNILYLVPEEE